MKIKEARNTTHGNLVSQKEFTIKASPKAFKILSDGLYQNKIKAIIRELSCNARDSHIEAGQSKPFEINFPTEEEPTFKIRDYGTGLSNEDVMNLYTTYFDSTKTNSNDVVGAFGLGSKSPFSYTDNFTVESFLNGTKTVFFVFFDDSFVPSISKVSEEPTNEENGLAISISSKENDIFSWGREGVEFFKYWEEQTLPNSNISLHGLEKTIDGQHIEVSNGWISNQGMGSKVDVLCGGVLYPIYNGFDNCKHYHYLLTLPIGSVDIAASRESLSLDKRTIARLKIEIDKANKEIQQMVDERLKYYQKGSVENLSNIRKDKLSWLFPERFEYQGFKLRVLYTGQISFRLPLNKEFGVFRERRREVLENTLEINQTVFVNDTTTLGFGVANEQSSGYSFPPLMTFQKDHTWRTVNNGMFKDARRIDVEKFREYIRKTDLFKVLDKFCNVVFVSDQKQKKLPSVKTNKEEIRTMCFTSYCQTKRVKLSDLTKKKYQYIKSDYLIDQFRDLNKQYVSLTHHLKELQLKMPTFLILNQKEVKKLSKQFELSETTFSKLQEMIDNKAVDLLKKKSTGELLQNYNAWALKKCTQKALKSKPEYVQKLNSIEKRDKFLSQLKMLTVSSGSKKIEWALINDEFKEFIIDVYKEAQQRFDFADLEDRF